MRVADGAARRAYADAQSDRRVGGSAQRNLYDDHLISHVRGESKPGLETDLRIVVEQYVSPLWLGQFEEIGCLDGSGCDLRFLGVDPSVSASRGVSKA
jgi:hypothetical protein